MRSDVIAVLEFLSDQYSTGDRRIEPNDAQVEFWLDALQGYDAETLRSAAIECVKTIKWYPKLSEFLEKCRPLMDAENWHRRVWRANNLFNACLRGEISDEQLEQDAAYKWFCRMAPPVPLLSPEEEEWAMNYDPFAEVGNVPDTVRVIPGNVQELLQRVRYDPAQRVPAGGDRLRPSPVPL